MPPNPMLEPELLEFLKNVISRNDVILEYGSGRSSIWISLKCLRIITVETSRNWANLVKRTKRREGIKNLDILVSRIGITGQGGIPIAKKMNRIFWKNNKRFVDSPFRLKIPFNLVFVDGRYRLASALTAYMRNEQSEFLLIVDDYFSDEERFKVLNSTFGNMNFRIGRAAVWKIDEPRNDRKVSKELLRNAYYDFN
jgi:hypothetical protein